MNQYNIPARQRMILFGMMGIGLLSLALTWMGDDQLHTRFWTNFLHNSVFFTGISLMATFFIAVCITAWSGWHAVFKRVWESFSMFLIPGFILMMIIAVATYLDLHHLYHWTDTRLTDVDNDMYDKILGAKSGFLNKNWYLFGTLIIVGLWVFFAWKLRSLSVSEDTDQGTDFSNHRLQRVFSAAFLPIAGFSSAAMIWQWVMSLDAHWYSTMFAWYTAASWFVSMIALTIMVIIYLKGKGYYKEVTDEHIHDLGKFLFAFSIFWTYLWFSQYMLIWYANVGEETVYFLTRRDEYPILFYGNLIMNFALPFIILLRNDTKRKYGSVLLVAGIVLFGHWWDFFQMIKPGALHTAHEVIAEMNGAVGHAAHHAAEFTPGFTLPGFLEIGTAIGFLGFFLYMAFAALGRAALVPKNDPYLEESLHHHV